MPHTAAFFIIYIRQDRDLFTHRSSERIFAEKFLDTARKLAAFIVIKVLKRIFLIEQPPYHRARAVGGMQAHQLGNSSRARRKDGMYLFHHVDIVASLGAVKRKADILVVSDGIFLPVHIVRQISRLRRLYLRIIHALPHISAADGVYPRRLTKLRRLFHAEGMYRYILRAESKDAVHGSRKAGKGIARQPRDKIRIHTRDTGSARIRICAEEILHGVRSADAGKDLLAERLGISFYDKQIIQMASDESGINEALFGEVDEKLKKSPLFRIVKRTYRGEIIPPESGEFVSDDNLFNYQAKVIRQLAEAESCVIIGRCADYVLKEFDHVISLFFYAPREDCIRRVQEISSEPEKEIIKKIEKTDKYRAEYYRYYTGKEWNDARNYDFCLNTTSMSYEKLVEVVKSYIDICRK